MQCPQCQAQNREGAQFCRECGTRFDVVCPACGARIEAGSSFCDSCGATLSVSPAAAATLARFASPGSYTPKHLAEKILTSRSAIEGERKQWPVLFAALSGFTSISERLDPEDVHGFMTRAFELMLAEVHRYEGTVNQFLGDGSMALFGAPLSPPRSTLSRRERLGPEDARGFTRGAFEPMLPGDDGSEGTVNGDGGAEES